MRADLSVQIGRCRSLAQEAAVGLLSCRERNDAFGTKLLMKTYAEDATALGVPERRAQSLLMSAITSAAMSGFRQLAAARNTTVDEVLKAEGLRVSTWAASRGN